MAAILTIDDDKSIHGVLSQVFSKMGHEATSALTIKEGLACAATTDQDLIILDLDFPEGNGLDILADLLACPSSPEVIILTGKGDRNGAEIAFRYGAWDFLQKPFLKNEVTLAVTRALQYRAEKKSGQTPKMLNRWGIVGSSKEMHVCLNLVAQAAASNTNVLIRGETGTGKELFARAIHDNSPRADRALVVVDCTVLPESLVESTLFGHRKGAFTGAHETQNGLIKQSHGGTLFLDEVGDLPLASQKSFLRVLQERRFRPVGSDKELSSDFRLIAATNRNLDEMVSKDLFREDLLFRLRSIVIDLPPLRERREDIEELIFFYLARLKDSRQDETKGISPEFLEAFQKHSWPGNVRELVNTLEGALAAAAGDPILHPIHLPPDMRLQSVRNTGCRSLLPSKGIDVDDLTQAEDLPSLRDYRESVLDAVEHNYLKELMLRAKNSRVEACRLSGLSEARLYALLKKHGLPRFRSC